MSRRVETLEPYRVFLSRWTRAPVLRAPGPDLDLFDALLSFRTSEGEVRYFVEERKHLRHQDAAVVASQLLQKRKAISRHHARDRILLLAPYVGSTQAAVLVRSGIDYIDLAGNAHLSAPGLVVHVEGQRMVNETRSRSRRPQKAWTKTVLALLVRPELAKAPYRVLADQAGVALGSVASCMGDLTARGLLVEEEQGRGIPGKQTLVGLWVQAYVDVLRPKLVERRFQVRSSTKQELWKKLRSGFREHGVRWALTGADAAERHDHYFHAAETEIYVPLHAIDDRALQKSLLAQPTLRDGNLVAIESPGPLAIPDDEKSGTPTAPTLLAYAELRYRGTGQALEAAELILPEVLSNGGR